MSGNFRKWNTIKESTENNLYVVLFVSRNKDNKDIKNFKERKKAFVSSKSIEELKQEFLIFCNKGLDSEMCRFYISTNARDRIKINKALTHFLIDNPEIPSEDIPAMIVRIAAKKENALEKKWLFDFDNNNEDDCNIFCKMINDIDPNVSITKYKTPNGFHIISNRGFDTRKLFEKFPKITLKKDDLRLVQYHINKYNIDF